MSTATITLTKPEAEAITRGRAVYRNATDTMWPRSVRAHAAGAITALGDALETWEYVLSEDIHPVAAYDGIEPGDQAYDQAITRGAQDVADLTAELIRVFPACATGEAGAAQEAARAREEGDRAA